MSAPINTMSGMIVEALVSTSVNPLTPVLALVPAPPPALVSSSFVTDGRRASPCPCAGEAGPSPCAGAMTVANDWSTLVDRWRQKREYDRIRIRTRLE